MVVLGATIAALCAVVALAEWRHLRRSERISSQWFEDEHRQSLRNRYEGVSWKWPVRRSS